MKALDLLPHIPQRTWVAPKAVAVRVHREPLKVGLLLRELKAEGLVERKGKGRGTKYRRVKTGTVEFLASPLPNEVGDYWAISTEYKTLREHYDNYQRRSVASIYRVVNSFKVLGLVEMEPGRGELNQAGKRVKRFRRKYRSVTFRDDGTVLFE